MLCEGRAAGCWVPRVCERALALAFREGQQRHVVRLETRPPNLEGEGRITAEDLLRNALRMRPDRIVVGEIRGGEALDLIQAMTSGHGGCLSTLHATYPRDTISRLEPMAMMSVQYEMML